MYLQRYLKPKQAAKYLSRALDYEIKVNNIIEMINEGILIPVFYYQGTVVFANHINESETNFPILNLNGFFLSCERMQDFIGKDTFEPAFRCLEIYELLNNEEDELLAYIWNDDDVYAVEFKISHGEIFPVFFDQKNMPSNYELISDDKYLPIVNMGESIFIPRAELDALITKHKAPVLDRQLHEKEEPSHLLLIAAMMEMLKTPRPRALTQDAILQCIEDEYQDIRGLSKSTTQKIMGTANKEIKRLKNKD